MRGASRASKGAKSHRRRYSGTLLVDDGRTSYRYDAAGRVVSMSRRRLSRKPDVWHYVWDAHDHLRSVTTPDGTVWTYTYDHVGRRLSKTNQSTGETTRFHWHGEHLVEQTDVVSGHDQQLRATTWTYSPAAYAPLAQTVTSEPIGPADDAADSTNADDQDRDLSLNLGNGISAAPPSARRWTQTEIDREFFAVVTDQIAAPTALIDPDSGEVAGRSVRTLYGATSWTGASTPWSYPGQYLDTETGLHYNRHRYYHSDTGRYLSSDPLGLAPAPNPHAYPSNPTVLSDPLGLSPTGACDDRGGSEQSTPERKLWEITKEGTAKTKKLGGHTYDQSKTDGLWWSRDTAGHGRVVWKVFEEDSRGLRWIADADEYGTFIRGKHKGPVGKFIPWKDLN